MDTPTPGTWQILDTGSIWMKEFASALSKVESVVAWAPTMEKLGMFRNYQTLEILPSPELKMLRFPLQRGYARAPLRWLAPFQSAMVKRMLTQTACPEQSPLVCSTPFYAPVAELWPGPVIYYVTDLTIEYEGLDKAQIKGLDQRMCRVARLVCPNSRRIASYLTSDAGCDAAKIVVVPNATRESNVAAGPQFDPAPLPQDVQDLPRPIVGVLGDLSGNMNWELIVDAMQRTPQLNWLFVGPTVRTIANPKQSAAREWAKAHARFVGMKPYGELQAYARCVDVAVLPYMKKEPTYSGSSTRFYEHLAAGRPMVATRGFAELLEKVPLLTLVDTAEEMAAALEQLRSTDFRDGQETARWEASKHGTWEERARTMRQALQERPAASYPSPATHNTWQYLDTGTIMMKEFASALSKIESVAAWSPSMERLGIFRNWQTLEVLPNPDLKMLRFPLQRGYARYPLRWLAPFQTGMIKRMLTQTACPERSPLICSTPFYAPVAELWPGPVIYYVTDLNVAYERLDPAQVRSLDQRMCRVARVVCPNSRRIATYLTNQAECDPAKITIIPNATRESNILPAPRYDPAPLPQDAQDLARPIIGVLGDLSGNMNWELIADAIRLTPHLSWLFVGPTNRHIADKGQRAARNWAKHHARFVGMKPYGELQAYARCVDAAVLPYIKNEPTYSGSSTRFYEHLAAGRPMVATRGFAELLEKEPLLTLVDTAYELVVALENLRSLNFQDGFEDARWEASKLATWEVRAHAMRQALEESMTSASGGPDHSGAEAIPHP